MTHGWKALVALFILASSSASNATRIDVLIGDEDGFGIGVKPNQGFLPNDLPGYAGLGDADGTDKWFFNQQSFAFNYTLPVFPINAARLEVFSGGQGYNAGNPAVGAPTSVLLDGTFIGYLTIGDLSVSGSPYNNFARRDTFNLKPYLGLLTGHDTLTFIPYSTGSAFGDGWVLDYTELTLQTKAVPEPATLGLMGLGLAGIGFARRKRKS